MNKHQVSRSMIWLTPDDLHRIFDIAKQTQAQYRSEKKIPFHKIGRKIFYKRSEIDKWIDDAKVI